MQDARILTAPTTVKKQEIPPLQFAHFAVETSPPEDPETTTEFFDLT